MRTVDLIAKTRDKQELSKAELEFLVNSYVDGSTPDYQMSVWAMAVVLNGLTKQETTDLTMAMAHSGDVLDLSHVVDIVVDKHSTGGVGDKTTLTVAAMVAACGLPVGKMSGRGLGFSGGTIDKLESIPGIKVDLSTDEFITQLKEHGIVLTGQSADLAPADGKLYSLRDVTATVQSIPLIASSVMSKKIAAGAQAIVLDVKVGKGAFMTTLDQAEELARTMVAIGELSGRKVVAVLSPMDQPLGSAVGNANELREAIEMLKAEGPEDYREHCLHLAAHMLLLGRRAETLEQGLKLAENSMQDGSAFAKFRELVIAQHGDVRVVDDLDLLPVAKLHQSVEVVQDGWVASVNAKEVGETAVLLGAGRAKKTDKIDLSVGIHVHVKIGDKVTAGQKAFDVHANDETRLEEAVFKLKQAVKISSEPVESPPLFWGVIGLDE